VSIGGTRHAPLKTHMTGTRASLKVDGNGEEMSEDAPLDMDDALEIIDPDNLLGGNEEDDGEPLSDDENEMEEADEGRDDEPSEEYAPERDDAKLIFSQHKGLFHFIVLS